MKKELIRKEAIKLRLINKKKYPIISLLIKEKYDYNVSPRTIRRWVNRLMNTDWNYKDTSQRPSKIYIRITAQIKKEAIKLRKKTGYKAEKIKQLLERKGISISKSSIELTIRQAGLSRESKMKGVKLKWVRWQREHPNSLWQLDGSGDENKGWLLPVIDDCSRYCLGVLQLKNMTTDNVTKFLEFLISIHGKPREILTDNGPEYSKEFDKWCNAKEIKHIRSAIHKPTTLGKVERFHKTMDDEMPYCKNNLELFRMRYNHHRPHDSLFGKTPGEVYFAFSKLF